MQILKKVDWEMFSAPRFWRWVPVGMVVGAWCFVVGVALYGCTQEPEPVAKEPTKVELMEMRADLEVLKIERAYEAMRTEQKMEGIVYE